MNFSKFAEYLQKLEGIASRNEMTVVLAEMFGQASAEDARLLSYLCQGKLGPAYKSPDFGVADKSMLKALGVEAKIIFDKLGDLGLVVERLKSIKVSKYKSIKVREVYDKLWEIATVSGTGSVDRKQQLIINLLDEVDPVSAKYIVKMILGKLRTGFSDMTILDSLSWMLVGSKKLKSQIEAMYNVRADLGEIARQIKQYMQPKQLDPEIGTPILMAKCEREVTIFDIWERLDRCAVEYKLDGLRIQAHISITPPPMPHRGTPLNLRGEIKLFSRGLEDVTHMYPDVCEGLAKQIKHDCIVEGEMIALDKKGNFLPFQETVQRKRKYDILEMLETIPLSIFLFDVLMLDGKSLLDEANSKRRLILESITPLNPPLNLRGGKPIVNIMPRIIAKNPKEIEDFFQKSLKAGTEGIIAKKLDGGYAAGSRDFNWIKYKASYQQSALSDTLDVVVLGFDEGQGKRSKFGIGDFLAGVYDPKSQKYYTVAKVGTGLTDEEWRRMKSLIAGDQLSSRPEYYVVSNQMKCDYWVEPKIVVELLADEITKSPMHTSGLALRFPRLVSWRDKKPTDTTSLTELQKMFVMQNQKKL